MHKNTTLLPLMLLALPMLAAPAFSADQLKSRELMTLASLHEFTAAALKMSLLSKRAEAGFSDAQVECIKAIPASKFEDQVTDAIAEGFSDEELASALNFYRSPAGKKLLQVMHANVRGEPLMVVSPADSANIEKFEASSAGRKLRGMGFVVNSDKASKALMKITVDAVDNCPKPAQ